MPQLRACTDIIYFRRSGAYKQGDCGFRFAADIDIDGAGNAEDRVSALRHTIY